MAKGQTTTVSQKQNNSKGTTNTVSKVVEQIVVNGALATDPKDIEPGVNTSFM